MPNVKGFARKQTNGRMDKRANGRAKTVYPHLSMLGHKKVKSKLSPLLDKSQCHKTETGVMVLSFLLLRIRAIVRIGLLMYIHV